MEQVRFKEGVDEKLKIYRREGKQVGFLRVSIKRHNKQKKH